MTESDVFGLTWTDIGSAILSVGSMFGDLTYTEDGDFTPEAREFVVQLLVRYREDNRLRALGIDPYGPRGDRSD